MKILKKDKGSYLSRAIKSQPRKKKPLSLENYIFFVVVIFIFAGYLMLTINKYYAYL